VALQGRSRYVGRLNPVRSAPLSLSSCPSLCYMHTPAHALPATPGVLAGTRFCASPRGSLSSGRCMRVGRERNEHARAAPCLRERPSRWCTSRERGLLEHEIVSYSRAVPPDDR
jgi:hypothetical protein